MQEKQDSSVSLIPSWTGGVPRPMNEVNRLGGVVEFTIDEILQISVVIQVEYKV